ncbi:unnamed protein product [Pleuronectes platessa]|uniref:Uncharacterized protein n=1 Tax=Pleuronectes platessa TaxID=8262 RepID=A0A9N7UDT7_PLEPL|nr:unnamed protein product [Pleuronectes platessa]
MCPRSEPSSCPPFTSVQPSLILLPHLMRKASVHEGARARTETTLRDCAADLQSIWQRGSGRRVRRGQVSSHLDVTSQPPLSRAAVFSLSPPSVLPLPRCPVCSSVCEGA